MHLLPARFLGIYKVFDHIYRTVVAMPSNELIKLCEGFLESCEQKPRMPLRGNVVKSQAQKLLQFFRETDNRKTEDRSIREALSASDWPRFLNGMISEVVDVESSWRICIEQIEESQKREDLLKPQVANGILVTATAWCGWMQVLHEIELSSEYKFLEIAARYAFQTVNDAAKFLTDIMNKHEEEEEEEDGGSPVHCVFFINHLLARFRAFYDNNLDKIETPINYENPGSEWFGFWSKQMQDEISRPSKRKRDSSPEGSSVSENN